MCITRTYFLLAAIVTCSHVVAAQTYFVSPINTYVLARGATAEQEAERLGSASSLRFDGVDDRVTVPYDTSFPTEVFTASAWIRLSQPAGRAAIIARGEDDDSYNLSWQLYVIPTGDLEVMLEDSDEHNYCYPLNN